MADPSYIRWFDELDLTDIGLAGGKNASLGELYRALAPLGVRVPNGFAVTADAYRDALAAAGGWERLHALLGGLDKEADPEALARAGAEARELVHAALDGDALRRQIGAAWRRLLREYGPELSVAVRSSAMAGSLPAAGFADPYDTYLDVRGEEMLFEACRRCFASLFTDRAISERIDQGLDHFNVAFSVGVMKMVRADLAAGGVMYSLDPETGFRDVVLIAGAYGLGETVVEGAADPDAFYVHKPTFQTGHRAVLRRALGEKQLKMIYAPDESDEASRKVPVPDAQRTRFCITDADVLTLADYAIKIEQHYSRRAGRSLPMQMEWAKDGLDGAIYIVRALPESVASKHNAAVLRTYMLKGQGEGLASGRAVGAGIASGPVRVITDTRRMAELRTGEVLVADSTSPEWEPVLKRAAAIVTNRGGPFSHAATQARELGIPAIVGAGKATELLRDGQMVTVACTGDDVGTIHDGAVPFEVDETDLSALDRPGTEIMVNLGNPELAFRTAQLPTDGVGLARMEFIIREHIRAHPMALLHPERVADRDEREAIAALTRHHTSAAEFFVEKLSEGIGTIAAAFYPRPVIVRLSDFRTDEYARLTGGRAFEPVDANPLLGFRGAARYAHPAYADGFALECAALHRVRTRMGLANVKVMVPFCRREEDARRTLDAMAANGLRRGRDGLEVYLMCETPNNILQIDAFARLFDGFSIGSDDLTQLVLGVDRESDSVAFDYDQRDPGVLAMMAQAIEGARRNGRHIGICGQAPSDHPEVVAFLVRAGIDSISLSPDRVIRMTRMVVDLERSLGRSPRPRR